MQLKFQSKLIVLLVSVFSSFLFASNVHAQESKQIEAIDIMGNRRLTDKEILQHIKTRTGETFDEKQAEQDLQSLLKLGVFDPRQTKIHTVAGIRGGLNVLIEIAEFPLIDEVKFEGLRYATKEELLAELQEQKMEVAANAPYQPEKLRKARQVIINYLWNKHGFPDSKVSMTEEEVSATTRKVTFLVDELPDD